MEGGLKSKRDFSLPKASTPVSFQSYSPCCWPDPIANLPVLGEEKSETEQERGTRSLKITARPWNRRGRRLMDKRSESCRAFPRDQDRKHTVGSSRAWSGERLVPSLGCLDPSASSQPVPKAESLVLLPKPRAWAQGPLGPVREFQRPGPLPGEALLLPGSESRSRSGGLIFQEALPPAPATHSPI